MTMPLIEFQRERTEKEKKLIRRAMRMLAKTRWGNTTDELRKKHGALMRAAKARKRAGDKRKKK